MFETWDDNVRMGTNYGPSWKMRGVRSIISAYTSAGMAWRLVTRDSEAEFFAILFTKCDNICLGK